ncbi:hypothetical protein BGX26_012006 [Mortierella sp. AD094]|nr:hypothetical protein BGX26_012006 [Mortierella sp. AD094]
MIYPSKLNCSSFVAPSGTTTGAIGDICKTSSSLPGFFLNTACGADSSLNAIYCAPLAILVTICTAPEGMGLTSFTCRSTYNILLRMLRDPWLQGPACLPWSASAKVVIGIVHSVCQDCNICPAPDALSGYVNCDAVKTWKGLCLYMPDKQCPTYSTMRNSTSGVEALAGSMVMTSLVAIVAGVSAFILLYSIT